jgi:D-glycero-D-manno-heptose 1,7-bisphosphate phosphatase
LKHPAIFLDRDGVIIENRPAHVLGWDDVQFLPGALQALAAISATPHKIVIATNQSAVGRGLLTLAEAERLSERIVAQVAASGGRIDAVYMCPHRPADECDCRKPRPGLVLRAAAELGLDLGRSLLIGDALTDLAAGEAAGIPTLALVKTGRGRDQLEMAGAADQRSFAVFEGLPAALGGLLQRDGIPGHPKP